MSNVSTIEASKTSDAKTREIYLLSDIYQNNISDVIKLINIFNYEDDIQEAIFNFKNANSSYVREPIILYISSYGGSCYDGLGLVGTIQASKTPVHVIAVGKVMSMGFLIACSAHKTYSKPNTTFMYHAVSSWAIGQIKEMQEEVDECKRLQKLMDAIILKKTKIKHKKLKAVVRQKKNWYFDNKKAIKLGIIEKEV